MLWNRAACRDLTGCVAGRQAVPKAQQFNQEVLLPAAKYISAELQAQAYEIAVQVRQPGNLTCFPWRASDFYVQVLILLCIKSWYIWGLLGTVEELYVVHQWSVVSFIYCGWYSRRVPCHAVQLPMEVVRGLQAGPLAKGLPMSLRRAVHRKAVPGDLEADLLRLAAAIEPLVPKVGPPCLSVSTGFDSLGTVVPWEHSVHE